MIRLNFGSRAGIACETVAKLRQAEFSPRDVISVATDGVLIVIQHDEHSIAHRFRQRQSVGQAEPDSCYILLTTMRRVLLFDDNHVVIIPVVQVPHVLFTDLKLTQEELEYASQFPMPECSVGKWLTQEIQKYFLGSPGVGAKPEEGQKLPETMSPESLIDPGHKEKRWRKLVCPECGYDGWINTPGVRFCGNCAGDCGKDIRMECVAIQDYRPSDAEFIACGQDTKKFV